MAWAINPHLLLLILTCTRVLLELTASIPHLHRLWPETGLQRSSPRLLDFNVIKTKQNYTFLSYSNTLIWSNSSIFSDISSPTLWESSCCLSNMWHIKLWGANASLICNSVGLQRCQRNQTTYFSVRTWKKQISIWLVLISISICLSFMFKRCIAKQIFFPRKQ